MNGTGALIDVSGKLAGRPLEEWNAAYVKVENYFHALRVRNKVLLGQLDRKSTRLNSSHITRSRMPSSA